MQLRTIITKSITHHKDSDGTMSDKINGLLVVHLQKNFYFFTIFLQIL
jgi:hypothetical protein